MSTTLFVPRTFGSTLILTITPPAPPPTPVDVTWLTRDNTVTWKTRDGQVTWLTRDQYATWRTRS